MKFSAVTYLAALASAASVDLTKRDSPLDLKLELVGNSAVKATLTNTGSQDLKIFKTGSILDEIAVEKSQVFSGCKQKPRPHPVITHEDASSMLTSPCTADLVEFDGVRLHMDMSLVDESNFRVIAAGETVEVQWDVAEDHDLTNGGEFDISSSGVFSYTGADSEDLTLSGTTTYTSNVLHASIDGEEAAKVRRSFHDEIEKRAVVQSDCTGTRRTAITTALSNCRALAAAAASAASSGGARMTEFFKSDTAATRSTVSTVFNRIATECGSSTSGASRQYCTDIYPGGACQGGVVAYTVPAQSYMVNCPAWFNNYPATSNACRGTSQSSVTLHEATHLTQIRGTSDYNCYGYTCLRGLSASQNINHADTYHLFSQGESPLVHCPPLSPFAVVSSRFGLMRIQLFAPAAKRRLFFLRTFIMST